MEPIIKRKYKTRNQWTDTAEQILLELWEDKILQLRGNRKNQHVYAEMSAELQKNGFSFSALDVKSKVHNLTGRYRKEKLLVGPSGGSPSEWPLYPRLHCLLGSYKYFNLSEVTYDSILATPTEQEAATASSTYDSILESASSAPSTSTAAATFIPIAAATSTSTAAAVSTPASSPASPLSPETILTSASPSMSPTPLPGKKGKFQYQIMQQINEVNSKIDKQIEKMEEMDNKMHSLECKKTELLEKLVNKQCEMVDKQRGVMDAILDYVNSKKY